MNAAQSGRPKLLYIAGTGRTGSTLLEKLLGSLDGVFAAGELTWLWYALRGDGRCSCGSHYRDCPVWGKVLEEAFGSADEVPFLEMLEARTRFQSTHLPLMAVPGFSRRRWRSLGRYPDRLRRLYAAIRHQTGCRLLLDSSKEPHYSYLLRELAEFDLKVVHLVRDPRAVAHSWSRVRTEWGFGEGHEMERRGPAVASAYFDVSNIATEVFWGRTDSYLRVRYEEFVTDPRGVLQAISELVDEPFDLDSLLSRDAAGEWVAAVRPIHSAWGNPNRFDSGSLPIRADEAWHTRMGAADRRVVSLLCGPVARRYGYPLWASGGSAGP